MKLTKTKLKEIIQEEIRNVLSEADPDRHGSFTRGVARRIKKAKDAVGGTEKKLRQVGRKISRFAHDADPLEVPGGRSPGGETHAAGTKEEYLVRRAAHQAWRNARKKVNLKYAAKILSGLEYPIRANSHHVFYDRHKGYKGGPRAWAAAVMQAIEQAESAPVETGK